MKSALNKKAFTLFELIIAIILIGLIYGVFVHKLSVKPTEKSQISLKEMKDFLQKFSFQKRAEIVCDKSSLECSIYIDEKKIEQTLSLFKSKPIVYTFDKIGKPEVIEFAPVFNKEGKIQDLCFRFKVFKNGGSDAFLVDVDDTFYVFKSLEKAPKVFTGFNEAVEYFDHIKLLPILTSDYQY